ncbi:MAG: hypothetical protein GX926_00275 [Candidatus Magasanikbacteria bacterium]|nr:hypothetical protein [Candidatus Magasanikbacteria bacterium]
MLNRILKILLIFLALVLVVAFHVGFSYLLPYPISKVNIIFTVIILLLLWYNSGVIVWISFFSNLFIELFTVSPYGVVLFSSTISVLIAYWLYQNFFTNRSIYAALVLTAFTIFIYRLFYIVIMFILKIFSMVSYVPWKLIFITSLWEILFTTILVSIFYFIFSVFTKKFKSSVVESSIFRYERK